MSNAVQRRRGTTVQHSTFTGLSGEVTVDTDKKTLVVHDGTTAGGNPLPTLTGTETLTNKTISLGSNTVSGTTAQFNSALSDGDFATLAGSETLTNKTLTAPTITGTIGTGNAGVTITKGSGAGTVPSLVLDSSSNQYGGLDFRSLGTSRGWIAQDSGAFYVGAATQLNFYTGSAGYVNGTNRLTIDSSGHTYPGADNTQTCGTGSKRWSTIYAGTGTINTSDARDKTPVSPLTEDEIAASKALAKEIGTYRFLAAVAVKGEAARRHVGMTVQRAVEIMEAHGLDPLVYGFICHDTWGDEFREHPAEYEQVAIPAVLDDDGAEVEPARTEQGPLIREAWIEQTQVAGDRYSFRPDELLLFIARGFDARLSALEGA